MPGNNFRRTHGTDSHSAGAFAAEGHSEDKRKWLVLIAMVFGLFMPQLDNLVLNVALPTIQRDFGAGVSGLQWIIDSYTLTFASFMLTAGALGDLYGRKRLFMGGLVLFSLGSRACGLSSSTSQLIAFRAAQGVGAAALLPGSLSIISATFHGRERGSAIGIWAAMSGVAAAIGPVAGGYLVEHFSWNSIFFINIPTGIVGLTSDLLPGRESKDATRSRRLDPPGLITGTAGLFCLVFALIEGNARGWTNPVIIGMFLLAAVLLTVFVIVESRRRVANVSSVFLSYTYFRRRQRCSRSRLFCDVRQHFFLTLYMQNILQYSPVQAGTRLLAFPEYSFRCAYFRASIRSLWFALADGLRHFGRGMRHGPPAAHADQLDLPGRPSTCLHGAGRRYGNDHDAHDRGGDGLRRDTPRRNRFGGNQYEPRTGRRFRHRAARGYRYDGFYSRPLRSTGRCRRSAIAGTGACGATGHASRSGQRWPRVVAGDRTRRPRIVRPCAARGVGHRSRLHAAGVPSVGLLHPQPHRRQRETP